MFVGHCCSFQKFCDQCNTQETSEEIIDFSSLSDFANSKDFPPYVYLPHLDTHNLKYLPASLESDPSKKKQLGSQGFYASPDESCAYRHETSVPLSYFLNEQGLPYLVNMDRGGITTKQDGSHAACIADGCGGDGYFSAFVAHMICEYFLNPFSPKTLNFTGNPAQDQQIARTLLYECAEHIHKRSPNTVNGSSTALFVDCVPSRQKSNKQMYNIQVASLGDCAVIHVDSVEKKASQLNKINREFTQSGRPDVRSTGGRIVSSAGVRQPENIIAAISEASEDDYLILVTDGFLDNVRGDNVIKIVELVIFNPFFDQPFEQMASYKRFWHHPRTSTLPTIEDITKFINTNCSEEVLPSENPTTAQVTQRLANYTKFVTEYRCREEESWYKTVRKKPMGSHQNEPPSSNNDAADDYDYDNGTPKTDDYMIITMKPGSSK